MKTSSALTPPSDIYQTVTDRIVAAIEAGAGEPVMPWHRTGLSSVIPINAVTGNRYRGINIVSLWSAAQHRDYPHGVWASYKQWREIGAQVRKGETSSPVVFYKEFEVEPDPEATDDDGKRRVARASHVFNCAQVDGYVPADPVPPLPAIERDATAQAFVDATGADIGIGGEQAYYRPATDHIQMPDEHLFRNPDTHIRSQDWFCVLSHELAHWSGAKHRLDRQFGKRFGDQAYCAEEMCAELTSAFTVTALGLTPQPRVDHARYIEHYLNLMKADKSAIFAAAAKAAQSSDYLAAFSQG